GGVTPVFPGAQQHAALHLDPASGKVHALVARPPDRGGRHHLRLHLRLRRLCHPLPPALRTFRTRSRRVPCPIILWCRAFTPQTLSLCTTPHPNVACGHLETCPLASLGYRGVHGPSTFASIGEA